MTITATVILAVAAVVVSVHSSSSPGVRSLAPAAPLAPTVTATKTDSLFTDVDGDSQADPGDTIKYSVNISASGDDATGVTFTDTVDPNTAFVPGSLTARPVAVDDGYAATGNIRISVAAPGVLGNDFTGVPAATITAPPTTSTNGGDVSLAADGSFTYNPPAGFEGVDTFSYTLTNGTGSNNATVSITVSGMIWFIDNNAAACTTLAAGCGRLTNPFSSLSAFAALNNGSGNNPAANDNIFVYESASDYAGPVTLLNGQRFIGQDATASLSSITGLTPPAGSDPLPTTNSANGTIVNITTGNAITVASGNTLIGFTGGDSTTDITGTGFGTLTISDVTLNGTGQALNLTTGALTATFGSISSTNSGTTGISLSGVAGSLTTPTTIITNPTGMGISVGTSSAIFSFGNTTSTQSGGTGVSLLTNTGTITFGALDISPDADQKGLVATDNVGTITSTGGTIVTSATLGSTNAAGVEITRASGTTPLLVVLTSVSTTNGTNGIILKNTSGSFSVIGDNANTSQGGNASGGTISNMSGADGSTSDDGASNGIGIGVYLNNATNVSLRRMTVTTSSNFGLEAENSNGLTSQYCKFNGTQGDNTTPAEGALRFLQMSGTVTIDNCEVTGSKSNNIRLDNNSGTLSDFVVSNSNVHDNDSLVGNDGISIDLEGTATIATHITGNSISNHLGDHLDLTTTDTANADVVITGNTCTGTRAGDLGRGIRIFSSLFNSPALVRYNISSNNMTGTVQGGAIHVIAGQGTGTYTGQINNNIIGTTGVNGSGASQSDGIDVEQNGNGAHDTVISGNNVRQYFQIGINVNVTLPGTTGTMQATVTSNTLSERAAGGTSPGVLLNSGSSSAPASSNQVCFDLNSNDITAAGAEGGGGQEDFRVRQRFSTTVRLPGYAGASNNTAAVVAFLQGQNTGIETGSATVQAPGGGFVGGGPCNAPSVPLALQPIGKPSDKSAKRKAAQPALPVDESSQKAGLWASFGDRHDGDKAARLNPAELTWMVQAAIERWRASAISAEDMARLQAVTFEIGDLPEGQVASASGSRITIDESAAGYGWFVDVSPMEDSEFEVPVPDREFQTTEFSPAFGRMDLLTVVMRELGLTYQRGENKLSKQLLPLMQNSLAPGVRRLPDSQNIQPSSKVGASGKNRAGSETSLVSQTRKARKPKADVSKSPASVREFAFNRSAKQASNRSSRLMNHAPMSRMMAPMLSSMLADVMLNIGTLPAGESVSITFNATVDDPFGGALPQVSNQGTVSGSNFADVLTDDPSVGGAADPTVTPIDLPQVSLAVSPASVLEDGATNLVYTFTRTGSTANAMTVNFSVGGTASFTEPDYTQTGAATFTATSGTVVIPGGSATATVTIDPTADSTVESDETVDLAVTSGTGYTVGSPSAASATITNDDADVSVAVAPASVAEDGATDLVYTFTRAGATTNALTVNFSVGGSANFGVSPNDYTQTGATSFTPPTGTVTFGAGNSTATVTVNPETDTTIEGDETVILTVTSGAGYNVSSPSSATGTITNDDADVSVAVSPAAVAEDGATNLVYTFTRTGFTTGSLTVNFSVGGTATFGVSPNDYTQTGATSFTTTTGSVTFTAGSPTATVTVNPETDATAESDETVIITLTAGASYNVVSPSSATGTILNDDTLVSVAVAPSSTAEGGANMVYTFTRTGPTTSALTVNFSVGGSASFPADYTQSGAATFTPPTATVNFGIGSSTATVTVTPLTDCSVEGSETVVFTVQSGSGYGVGAPSTATGTITNTPDSTVPTITCNADVVADFDPGVGGAVVTYVAPVGSDNCPGATTSQIAGLPSGGTFPLGTTTNTFRVTDASGNTAECSFKVTVALTSIIGLDSVTISGASFIDSYNSAIGYPASKSSLANVLSNGTITMGNSGKVWGNVRSTQAGINMTGASQVTGNATAGTTVSLSGSASVGGTITNGAPAPAITLPAVPACGPPYSPNSGISGTYSYNPVTGDLSLSGVNIATLANGNYCFHNITMGNSAQLKVNGLVNIKMTGTLNLSGNTSFTNTTGIPGNLRILSSLASGGNGVVLGNGTNVTMVVYAPQTGVSISGSAPLFGTVAAKRITMGNSGALHYDTQLKTIWPALWVLIVGP
jgi:hypothetical protein